MSKQLTLTDVGEKQIIRMVESGVIYSVGEITSDLITLHAVYLNDFVLGAVYTIPCARDIKVELMELVPKDRESDLLGIIQEIKDEHRNRLTPRCWNLVNDAIEEAKGE